MRLARLTLDHFRSYASAELHLDPGLTIVAGPNGAGKTNLLEAIVVAITGRSPRAAVESELVQHGAPYARIRLDLADPEGGDGARVEMVLPGAVPPTGLRKRMSVNGLARRSTSVGEVVARRALPSRGDAPARRLARRAAPVHGRHPRAARPSGGAYLVELARVLAQRNALLRAIRREEAAEDGMAFWDEQLVTIGARVTAARLALVGELATRIGPLHDAVAPADERADAAVRVDYADSLAKTPREGRASHRGDRRRRARGRVSAPPRRRAAEGALERGLAGRPAA